MAKKVDADKDNSKTGTALALDDPLARLSPEEMEEIARPERVVKKALADSNLAEALEYGRTLGKLGNVVGINKAQLLYLLRESWAEFTAKGAVADDFESVIEAQMAMTPANVKKYADAWATLIAQRRIPDKFSGAWLKKPIESWLAIRAAAADGLTAKKWEEATLARKPADVKRLVRSVRGQRTSSKNALVIQLRRRTGELRAWKGNSRPVVVGLLKMDDKSQENEVIKAATDRLLAAAGVVLE